MERAPRSPELQAKWLEAEGSAKRKKKWTLVYLAALTSLVIGVLGTLLALSAHEHAIPPGVQPAIARVVRAGEGSCLITNKGEHCFELTMEVHPTTGAPFTTKLTTTVENQWSSRVQPGSWVNVAIDANEPHKIYLDTASFELPPPSPPSGGA